MIVVESGKEQVLDADHKPIQQNNFTANLDRAENTRIFFILEEAKETFLQRYKIQRFKRNPIKFTA